MSKAGKARAHTVEDCMYGLTHKVEYSSCAYNYHETLDRSLRLRWYSTC